MYSREEAAKIRQAFWTRLGQYLSPIPGASGKSVQWMNYKTGFKHVYFRMQVEDKTAFVGIELAHPDESMQELFFQQFEELKLLLHSVVEEEWDWQLHITNGNGQLVSRIGTYLSPTHIMRQSDWPTLIQFFKPRIIALDAFWEDAKMAFEALK